MTVIRPNSISGINSITAQSSALNYYDSAGNKLAIDADITGNITGNVTGDLTGNVNSTGVSTITTLRATSLVGVNTVGVVTVYASGSLQSNSIVPVGGLPAGASGGGIIQIVQATKTDTWSTTTTDTWLDVSGWTATITPRSTSNKVMIIATGNTSLAGSNDFAYVKLLRGSTDIYLGDSRGSSTRCSSDIAQQTAGTASLLTQKVAINYLDSPATTSSTTYKIQARLTNGGGLIVGGTWNTIDDNRSSTPTNIILMEVSG